MSLRSKIVIKLRNILPQKFFGTALSYLLLDHIEPYVYMDSWSSLPFNGQVRRMSIVAGISENVNAYAVIETGTYLGSSTPYLAGLFKCKTYTIEIESRYAEKARNRFLRNHQKLEIELRVGDSASEIRTILRDIPSNELVIAYLDAHWLDMIPTRQEIESLQHWAGDWIAIIDDFEVPHDNGYKFDIYGQVVIGPAIIPTDAMLEVWVPSESSTFETGVKSGTGYVFSNRVTREKIPEHVLRNLIRVM
jgi:hypothetical protein